MDVKPVSRKQEILTILAVLFVIAAVTGAVVLSSKKKAANLATTAITTPADTTATTTTPTATASPAASYKDGSYTATANYDSPGGTEQLTISLTLQNDIITATSARSGSTSDDSQEYQDQFIAVYKQLVVGKAVTSVHLSRVAGSSLTSQGFNAALAQIEKQAQA